MRSITVITLFILSVFLLVGALSARAELTPRVEPRLSAPVPLELSQKDKKKEKKDKDKDGKKGEEEEEELAPAVEGMQAVEWVDPGAVDQMFRLRLAIDALAARR
jgi:hypothetical protein